MWHLNNRFAYEVTSWYYRQGRWSLHTWKKTTRVEWNFVDKSLPILALACRIMASSLDNFRSLTWYSNLFDMTSEKFRITDMRASPSVPLGSVAFHATSFFLSNRLSTILVMSCKWTAKGSVRTGNKAGNNQKWIMRWVNHSETLFIYKGVKTI